MTTTEQLKDSRAFMYKTDSIHMLLNDKDGFDPINDGFHKELFKYAYPQAKTFNDIMVRYSGKPLGIEFKHRTDERYTVILPDASEPGRFRISYFDKQGFSSHQTFDTIEKAAQEMIRDSYCSEARGILSKLSVTSEFEIGNKVSTLIGKMNSGQITYQEFIDQRQAIYDSIKGDNHEHLKTVDMNTKIKSKTASKGISM